MKFESQLKEVVVVVAVFGIGFVVGLVVAVLIVGHGNPSLQFDQNWVNKKWYIVV